MTSSWRYSATREIASPGGRITLWICQENWNKSPRVTSRSRFLGTASHTLYRSHTRRRECWVPCCGPTKVRTPGLQSIAFSNWIPSPNIFNTFDLARPNKPQTVKTAAHLATIETLPLLIAFKAHGKLGTMYFCVLSNIRWQKSEKLSSRFDIKWHKCRFESIGRFSHSTGRRFFGMKG